MLELDGFDGVSGLDAPDHSGRDARDYWVWGLWIIAYDVLVEIWLGMRGMSRKKRIKKLQDELLPQFPNTIICPRCLITIERP